MYTELSAGGVDAASTQQTPETQKKYLKYERRHVEMKNEKLVYSTPSIKLSLVEEDILTWSTGEVVTGEEVEVGE